MSSVRDSISHLFSLARFNDIRVDATLDAGRVALRYELSPIHPVTKIEFRGPLSVPGIDTGQLRQAVTDRYGTSPSLGRVEELKELIGNLLLERGYLHPDIRPRAEIAHDPDRATLVFDVDPGPRTVIGTVDIDGLPTVSRPELIARLDLAPGTPYRRDALNTRIEKYVADRRKAGYYEDKVMVTPLLVNGDRTANLVLTVMPGPRVRVVFKGDSLPPDKREDLVPVEREGSVDEDLLEDSTNRIEEGLREEGYRDAKAPHTRTESNGELLVTFDVMRGPQYRVDRVEIVGNASVPSSEFEPTLRLRGGAPFSEAKLDADIAAIEDLYHRRGFVSAKAQSAEEPQREGVAAGPVPLHVRITISEGPRTLVSAVRLEGDKAGMERRGESPDCSQAGRRRQAARPDRDTLQLRITISAIPLRSSMPFPVSVATDDGRADVYSAPVHVSPSINSSSATCARARRRSSERCRSPGDPGESAKIESRRRSRRSVSSAAFKSPSSLMATKGSGTCSPGGRIAGDDGGTAPAPRPGFVARAPPTAQLRSIDLRRGSFEIRGGTCSETDGSLFTSGSVHLQNRSVR